MASSLIKSTVECTEKAVSKKGRLTKVEAQHLVFMTFESTNTSYLDIIDIVVTSSKINHTWDTI